MILAGETLKEATVAVASYMLTIAVPCKEWLHVQSLILTTIIKAVYKATLLSDGQASEACRSQLGMNAKAAGQANSVTLLAITAYTVGCSNQSSIHTRVLTIMTIATFSRLIEYRLIMLQPQIPPKQPDRTNPSHSAL